MSARPWSLARRLTGLYLGSIAFFVLAISAASAWFVRYHVSEALDQLPHEELGELADQVDHLVHAPEELQARLRELSSEHPDYDLAWRIWLPDGQVLECGPAALLAPDRPQWTELDFSALGRDGDLRWMTARYSSGARAGLVVDGRKRFEQLAEYELAALIVLLGGMTCALLLASFFFRRVSRLLAEVAQRTRAVHDPEHPIEMDLPHAPIEIREVADALRTTLETIRRETQQSRLFTAGLAHELRSPIQNLVGEVEVALLQPHDEAAYREVLQSNLEELRALGDAVDNLVTMCSSGDAHKSPAREQFELGPEAELRLRRERAQAERRGLAFELSAQGDTRMSGDREAILRALRNLVANAIQWCEPGGRVRVALQGGAEHVELIVDDDGPGVGEELRERIFEPFFRGPKARGQRIGYGLGLALVRKAVTDQGGQIRVERSPWNGARFHLVLPRLTQN